MRRREMAVEKRVAVLVGLIVPAVGRNSVWDAVLAALLQVADLLTIPPWTALARLFGQFGVMTRAATDQWVPYALTLLFYGAAYFAAAGLATGLGLLANSLPFGKAPVKEPGRVRGVVATRVSVIGWILAGLFIFTGTLLFGAIVVAALMR